VHWRTFVERQMAGCVERQRRCGVPERWLEQIPDYLASVDLRLDDPPPPVLLHTEIMRDHLLADRRGAGWELTGMIDFEPAMVGHPEYELASVGTMVARGDLSLLRAYLLGYGYRESDLTPELGKRMMAYALLHRYSNLAWYMELMPMSDALATLDDLERAWWSFG
jgi:hygromycin-B 7''-O-kinase